MDMRACCIHPRLCQRWHTKAAEKGAAGAKQHHRNIYDHNWRRRGVVVSGVRRMNKVNARWARLVPGRVTVFEREYHLGM